MKIKICSLILIFCMLIACVPIIAADDIPQYNEDMAYAILGYSVEKSNINDVRMGRDKNVVTVQEQGDGVGWLLKAGNYNSSSVMVDLDDKFANKNKSGTEYIVEVDYFDLLNSKLVIQYDSLDMPNQETDVFYLGNTGEHRTHSFVLDDAYFGNRLNDAYDFAVTTHCDTVPESNGNVVISAIRVYRNENKHPIMVRSIKTNEVGNIFGNGDEQSFTAEIANWKGVPTEAEITYYIKSVTNAMVWSKTEKTVIPTEGLKDIHYTADIERYGLYKTGIKIEGNGFSHTLERDCSFINTRTDGKKNPRFGYATHLENEEGYGPLEDAFEVLDKSGASFIRGPFDQWRNVDPVNMRKNTFVMTEYGERLVEKLHEYGLGYYATLGMYMPNKYGGWKSHVSAPITEDGVEGFANYTKNMASYFKKNGVDVVCYEIWNEPEVAHFNDTANSEQFAYMAGRAAEAIIEVDPSAINKIGVSNCTTEENAFFVDPYKTYGDVLRGLSMHPYAPNIDYIPEVKMIGQKADAYKAKYTELNGREPGGMFVSEYGRSASLTVCDDYNDIARYTVRDLAFNAAYEWYDKMAFYEFSRKAETMNYREHTYGHVECARPNVAQVPFAAKEGFAAEVNFNTLMCQAKIDRTVIENDDKRYAFLFNRGDGEKPMLCAWTEDDTRMISFKSSAPYVTVYDMYGNSEKIYGKNGVYSFVITGEMQYIEGDISDLTLTENPIVFEELPTQVASGSIVTMKLTEAPVGLTAEVYEGEGIKYVSGKGSLTDKSEIKVSIPDAVGALTHIQLDIMDGDKKAYSYRFPIEITEAVEMSIQATPKSVLDTSHWNLVTAVKNNRSGAPLSGKLEVVGPEDWTGKVKATKLGIIPEQRTGIVNIESVAMNRLVSKNVTLKLTTDAGEEYEYSQIIDFAVAAFIDKAPTIDGNISQEEWYYSTIGISDEKSGIYPLNGEEWGGAEDVSGRFMFSLDRENLYMAAIVTDDVMATPENGESIWKNDSIQFGVAFRVAAIEAFYGGDYTEIGVGDTSQGPIAWRYGSLMNFAPSGQVDSAKAAVKREGNQTYYEMSIPWTEITKDAVDFDNLEKIGFSLLINDNDGKGRKQAMQYGGGIVGVKDISQFKFLNVMKP